MESFPAAVCSPISPGSRRWPSGWRSAARLARSCRVLLNAYFGQLMALIAEHGGEVITFAGDGLLAAWPAIGEDWRPIDVRAGQAAP